MPTLRLKYVGLMPRILTVCLTLLGGFTGKAFAQASMYRVSQWTTDNGLPQNTVRSIQQTRDGYLWLTTFDGLVRFDGVRFTVFNKSNTPGILSNRFIKLREDKYGTLWAQTEDGNVTAYRNGDFKTYTTADGLPSNRPVAMGLDGNGELYRYAGKEFVYWRGGRFVKGEALYDPSVSKMLWGNSGKVWKITLSGVTESQNSREITYPIPKLGTDIRDLFGFEDRQKQLWVGNQATKTLYCLREGQIVRYSEKDGIPRGMSLLPIDEDLEGGIWFYSRAESNRLVRLKDGRFTSIGQEEGLPLAFYTELKCDHEGAIWVGTSQGLYCLKRNLLAAYSTENGLSNNEIYPMLQTRNGDIYIGSRLGVSRFRGGRFEANVLVDNKANVQSLWEDRAGRLWIGKIGGLYLWDRGRLVQLPPIHIDPFAIREDSTGIVWVATNLGLMKFQGSQLLTTYTTSDGLPSNDVKVIHEVNNGPHKGELWFGTYGGLAQFKDGRFMNYTTAQGLAGNSVRSIYEDAEGTLWIGTYDDGLSRFRDGKFFNYRTEHGLYSNGVFQILEDKRGYFWISCNNGIYRVSRQELNDFAAGHISKINSISFGKSDGMLSLECNGGRQPAGLITKDGKFWFPTMGGIAVVDPDAIKPNLKPPPVFIESITLERSQIDFQNGVAVQAGQRDLEINYTGLSFIKPEQVKFKYMLEGLRSDWVDAGTRRTAYYPYLPPGNYTFHVIAANADGVWNTTGARLHVSVLAPFWRTWWFALISVSVGLGIVSGGLMLRHRNQLKKLEQARASQARFSRQLIESQEHERKRIAAELHDGLGQRLLVIKNWAEMSLMLAQGAPSNTEQMREISENASLALEDTRRVVRALRPYQLDKVGLTTTLNYMIESVASASGISITASIANMDHAFSPEEEVSFYRIVQECLNNVVKHSGATEALILIERGATIRLQVSDNGRGFAINGLDPKERGLGLSGIAERASMLKGTCHIESLPGHGTTVSITIGEEKAKLKQER